MADGEGKDRRQSDEKQRAILEGESEPVWQGKCGSVSGGRFGVCITGITDSADFPLVAACPRPAHHSVSRRGFVQPVVASTSSGPKFQGCPDMSAGTLKIVTRYSLLVIRHSSLVTSPGIVTTGNLLRHFLAPCSPGYIGCISFLLVWSMPSGRGPAGEGPTLIIVGKGEEGTLDMMHRPLPISEILYNFPQYMGMWQSTRRCYPPTYTHRNRGRERERERGEGPTVEAMMISSLPHCSPPGCLVRCHP